MAATVHKPERDATPLPQVRAYQYALALRYLLSRPINLLGIVGILLSVWALIVVVSIFSGFLREVQKHLQSSTADLTAVELPDAVGFDQLAAIIDRDPDVAACSPRLVWQGLVHPSESGPDTAPLPLGTELGADTPFVSIIGIDPPRERGVTAFDAWVRRPDVPDLRVADPDRPLVAHEDLPALLLGTQRMRHFGLRRGERAHLSIGQILRRGREEVLDFRDAEFRIAGAFETTYAAFDSLNVFVHIDALRELLSKRAVGEGFVNEIAIRLRDPGSARQTAQRLERVLNDELRPRRGIVVRTWAAANRSQLSSVDHQRSLMKLVLFVITVVAAFLMYATLSMMVAEKTHDIGILTAMGAHPRGVMSVFMACGVAIGSIGVVGGVVSGCLTSVYLDDFNRLMRAWLGVDLFPIRIYHLKRVPYDLDPIWIVQVSITTLVVALIVSALPAWRAARHDPLTSLRNE